MLSRFSTYPASGSVLYLHLLLAQVHLDDLLFLDDLFAEPDLLLEHDSFGDDDLLLEYLYNHLLVLADLRSGGLSPLTRYALDVDLLAHLGHPYLLTLGADLLADVYPACLTLARPHPSFFLAPLYPGFARLPSGVGRPRSPRPP